MTKKKYLILKDIIDKTYLDVYKIPIKIEPGMSFEHLKNTYNYLVKATNIDMQDFIRFSMENWKVIMNNIASPTTRDKNCMKVFHLGYFAAAIKEFIIIYADSKNLIGYIPGDFRHNEVVDLVRKGLSKEDAEKRIEAKYSTKKPDTQSKDISSLISENTKLRERVMALEASLANTREKNAEELSKLTSELRELQSIVQKYRQGELKMESSFCQSGPYPVGIPDHFPIGLGSYPELNIPEVKSVDILTNWHEADQSRREEIRRTRQYITQPEMFESFWGLVDANKKDRNEQRQG